MSTKLEPKSHKYILLAIPKKQRDTISSTLKKTKCLLLKRESSLRRNSSRKGIQEILNLEKFKQQQPVEPEVEQTPQSVEGSSTDLDTQPLRRSTRECHVPERWISRYNTW